MIFKKSTLGSLFLILMFFNKPVFSCEKKVYTIGVQAIDYTPHYNFGSDNRANFFNEFVTWLSQKTGCEFQIKPLPIKRLKLAFEQKNDIDFIYPDNPNWHDNTNINNVYQKRIFSQPIAIALGGTIVKESNKKVSLGEFEFLAFPRGFTPVAWLALQQKYEIKFREVTDAKAALLMVQSNRVDGADIEYNVAQYIIKKYNLSSMVLAKNLPFTPTDFHLATLTQPGMMKKINTLILNNKKDINKMKLKVNLIEKKP
jgi:hypothetical protein